MANRRSFIRLAAAGGISGLINGLFGGGGGVLAVIALRALLPDERRAHATATLTMLVMSGVSLCFYALSGSIAWREGLSLLPGGLIGAGLGALALKKIDANKLRRLFAALLVLSGLFLFFR